MAIGISQDSKLMSEVGFSVLGCHLTSLVVTIIERMYMANGPNNEVII